MTPPVPGWPGGPLKPSVGLSGPSACLGGNHVLCANCLAQRRTTSVPSVTMAGADEISREELTALLDLAGELSTQVDHRKVVAAVLERACASTHSPEGSVLL